MTKSSLTAECLRERLHYNPDTGIFTWIVRPAQCVHIGDVAGCLYDGYRNILIFNQKYKAHRLAWLYMTGEWPAEETDHKNGVRSDNRWCNLRLADKQLNMQNKRTAQKNNLLGFLGVSKHKKKFQASISFNGAKVYLGVYETPELAHAAYLEAKRQHHPGCTI